MTEPLQIAIIGLGTVGTGVARILSDDAQRIERAIGRPIRIKHVVVSDLSKPRGVNLPSDVLTDDLQRVTHDPEVQLAVQLVGGVDTAETIMQQLIAAGKDVVTANKALLAEKGPDLFDQARRAGHAIAFEAAVAGGVPIIAGIGQSLAANSISSLHGILNGTSNFIVSQMEQHGASYDEALAEAQRRGFAEADPRMDVDGSDAAQKLAILAQLAFRTAVDWQKIPRVGIDVLQQPDMRYARELGYRIKLLAVAEIGEGDQLHLHVTPTLVHVGTPLAEVRGANNAISVVGHAVGRIFFHGLGAGEMPTASAVVADVIAMALGTAQMNFRALDLWSHSQHALQISESGAAPGRYYLRLRVVDASGVLAEVAGLLSANDISIASVIQHETVPGEAEEVDLVIMTHTTTEGAIENAVEAIVELTSVTSSVVKMRVADGCDE